MGSLELDHSSDEDTDMSDSELDEEVEQYLEELKNGKHMVKGGEGIFMCPFCQRKRKRDFNLKDLLQHASGVGKSNSDKRSSEEKAKHLALTKYLENHLVAEAGPSKSVAEDEPPVDCDQDEKFVWPWVGVVANIPTRRANDGRFVGESGSKLRDEYIRRGFNPTRVHPLWNFRGHSGSAIVEFKKDWHGYYNAMAFEGAYEAERHGKKDWFATGDQKSGLYAWVARSDDYKANNIVGEHLRKIGDLKSIPEIMEEEARKQSSLVSNLTSIIEDKNKDLEEMELKCNETTSAIKSVINEKDKLVQAYNEDIKKIQVSAQEHFKRIFNDHQKLKLQLESQKKELESHIEQMEQRAADNESESRKLAEEIEKNSVKNCSLQLAAAEQVKANDNLLKLAEDQKREKEELHKKIIKLEKDLDTKQALELQIEQLRGNVNVVRSMGDDGDAEVLKKVDTMLKDMSEKEGELEDLEALNQTLIVKERKSNDELQDARKELINGLKELDTSNGAQIGIKRLGELNKKPFLEAMRRKYKYNVEEAEDKAEELRILWQEYLREPEWHPFKVISAKGGHKEIINGDDVRLKRLKDELGNDAYNAVTSALMEINQYNPSGRYITEELWHHGYGRQATLKEGAAYILKEWKQKKQRLDMD
ncbi:protein INVOLVED IN DE NOVO 2 [Argentina anserina]|uniref:protein INVOLVED IN DE NOVO 2 n=1 Tax=Argentina anserina TaxID=57926 RepID=UPI0021765383|nr:protein INVOLVED IN DE NOVO 2 [Potentilla anserina]